MQLVARLERIGLAFSSWTERWIPDSWIVCMGLTAVAFGLAWTGGGASIGDSLVAWGDGTWVLLELAMQFTLATIAAHACVSSPVVYGLFDRFARIPDPERPGQAVALLAATSIAVSFVNWAVSVVGCALLAAFLCRRNPKADIRLLAACSLLGMGTVWHGGLSGSAPLILATPGNPLLEPAIGSPIVDRLYPITETILIPFNLVYLLVVGIVAVVAAVCLHPTERAVTLSPEKLAAILPKPGSDAAGDALDFVDLADADADLDRPARRIDSFRGWSLMAACLLLYPLGHSLATRGFGATWTINAYNTLFLALALLLHPSPTSFLRACRDGVGPAWGIIVQFPFYAGIFGLIQNTGLGDWLGALFAAVASPDSFNVVVYVYSAIMNLFVPSAGSKWLIEAPYLIPAANQVGVSTTSVLLAYAYGDSTTNLVQPFLAIPVLSILRMRFGEIAGYMMIISLPCFLVTLIAMALMPTGL